MDVKRHNMDVKRHGVCVEHGTVQFVCDTWYHVCPVLDASVLCDAQADACVLLVGHSLGIR